MVGLVGHGMLRALHAIWERVLNLDGAASHCELHEKAVARVRGAERKGIIQ
jgi:hypothetical protein